MEPYFFGRLFRFGTTSNLCFQIEMHSNPRCSLSEGSNFPPAQRVLRCQRMAPCCCFMAMIGLGIAVKVGELKMKDFGYTLGIQSYCWWKKSGDHQLRMAVYPIIYRVLHIPGGAGFLPSTVLTENDWGVQSPPKCTKKLRTCLLKQSWMMLIEGSLEVYLPTIWTVEKQSREVKSEVRSPAE